MRRFIFELHCDFRLADCKTAFYGEYLARKQLGKAERTYFQILLKYLKIGRIMRLYVIYDYASGSLCWRLVRFFDEKMLWFAVRFYFQLKQNNIRQTKFLKFSIQFLGTFIERETRT